ncbi:P1 family peptidase [Clostridium lundense]|uniref:DmpA family aminopeptidase n=1 Tax=Clostridium lundense TaxID=319475 RepID=UPI000486CF94|nr:P1 family peptidase [Clostridium lundense]
MKRIRDYGINIGKLKTGKNNLITDVRGVKVGHATLKDGNVNTGVTSIILHEGNIFKEKLYVAVNVMNGFGKTIGTVQMEELGTIETPIVLTNTLNVGKVADALVEYMLSINEDIGLTTGTINPVVCECNDGFLNDIRGRHVGKKEVFKSLNEASEIFEEGAVGAGTGMSCFGYKGGIGSSSRVFNIGEEEYTIGALVLSNFGLKDDFALTKESNEKITIPAKLELEKGSIIVVLVTDAPMSDRQLKRVAKRASVGIIRLGSFMGNGSGDIIIATSTANKINHYEDKPTINIKVINENFIDMVFRAAAESVEEAILNSMVTAESLVGRDGNTRISLKEQL